MTWRGLTGRGSPRAAFWTLVLLLPAHGAAAGIVGPNGNYLTGSGAGGIQIISDGASNTIQFTETTSVAVCLDQVQGNVPLPSISDGSSNTLLFGEGAGVTVRAGHVYPRVPISQISDGTSNTIIFGEIGTDSLCLGDGEIVEPSDIADGTSNTIIIGETSELDVCFRNVRVGTIADGTSNTIQFGDVQSSPVCFQDVRVPTTAVPAPSALTLLAVGLLGLGYRRRRG